MKSPRNSHAEYDGLIRPSEMPGSEYTIDSPELAARIDDYRMGIVQTNAENGALSLIICDIDLFRSYNEHYGNHAGDQCLVRIGQVITDGIERVGGLAARYSGEQFSVLLPDTTETKALEIADTIRQTVHDQTILHAGSEVERVVTASFGVATLIPTDSGRQSELVEAADHALTRAKRGGGNCVFAIYGDMANDEK
jgi:diguanylate cyclase (GGDEF)-like protein